MSAWHCSPEYRKARRAVLAEERTCWICGASDFVDGVARHPRSRSVDHVVPLHRGGHPWARHNLRLAHYGCNSSKGSKVPTTPHPPALPPRSEDW